MSRRVRRRPAIPLDVQRRLKQDRERDERMRRDQEQRQQALPTDSKEGTR